MKNNNKIGLIGLLIIAIFIVPLIIDLFYKTGSNIKQPYNTLFNSSDILSYYGALLTGVLTVAGVFLTVKYSQKEYKEDMINRVLPFFTVDLISNVYKSESTLDELICDAYEDMESNNVKKENDVNEYNFKSIYFIISNKIHITYQISEFEKTTYLTPFRIEKNDKTSALKSNPKSYLSFYLINCGNGPAINLSVLINKEKDEEHKKLKDEGIVINSTVSIPVHVSEKIYIALCINNEKDQANGEYILNYNFSDIYNNEYKKEQRFRIKSKAEEINTYLE